MVDIEMEDLKIEAIELENIESEDSEIEDIEFEDKAIKDDDDISYSGRVSEVDAYDSFVHVPSPFHSKLKSMLDDDNENGFRKLVKQKKHNLHQLIHYNYFSYKSLLEVACSKGKSNFVKILLDSGARVNYINKFWNRAPIHFASENGHHNVIKVLLAHETHLQVDVEAGHRFTALYLAVKNRHIECVKTLLDIGANPNIPDRQGVTPLHLAVARGYNDIVNEIMANREKRVNIDIDSYYDISNGITTRQLLLTKYPNKTLPQKAEREINFYDLRFYVDANKFNSFFKNIDKITEIDDLNKLIVFCAKKNIPRGIDKLLKRKKTMSDDGLPNEALVAAVRRKNYEIVQKYAKFIPSWKIEDSLVLSLAGLRGFRMNAKDIKKNLECFKLILNQPDINVRCEKESGATPLHSALFYYHNYDDEVIKRLLQLGSCIGHYDSMGLTPIDFLSPMILSEYFDSCIRFVNHSTGTHPKTLYDPHLTTAIEFDYKCLQPLPMPSADAVSFLRRDRQKCREFNQLELEMKPLKLLSERAHMKHLLHHPLLSSFLTLKSYRIQKYVYANILFYVFFCFLMTSCIFFMTCMNNKRFNGTINGTFDGKFEENLLLNEIWNGTIEGKFVGTTIAGFNGNIIGSFNGTINETIINGTVNKTIYGLFSGITDGTLSLSVVNLVSYSFMYAIVGILTVIFLILLVIRELIEFISIPIAYCQSIQNGLEIILIILSGSVISGVLDLAFSSFIFIFLAWKIVDMLQQFQRFSVSVQMLKIVSCNLLRHLVFYVLFIFAFSLIFLTLFQNEDEQFENISSSLFKTIVMLTGEFDASNIPFGKISYLGKIIFVLFIFFVVIILFNFFNGLAIFDTTQILEEAETIKLVSQVEQISYIEQLNASVHPNYKVFSSRLLPQWVVSLYYFFFPIYVNERGRRADSKYCLNFLTFMKTRVFPDYLPHGKVIVELLGPKNWVVIQDETGEQVQLSLSLDDKILKSAKEILFKKNHISDCDKIINEVANYNRIVNNRIEEITKNIKIELERIYSKNKNTENDVKLQKLTKKEKI